MKKIKVKIETEFETEIPDNYDLSDDEYVKSLESDIHRIIFCSAAEQAVEIFSLNFVDYEDNPNPIKKIILNSNSFDIKVTSLAKLNGQVKIII